MTIGTKCRLGLTGGMGAGKSTVARIFAALGAEIIDADMLTRSVHRDETIIAQLVSAFGPSILIQDSDVPQIHRPSLAQKAFANPVGVQQLNDIMRPALRLAVQNALELAKDIVILDAALLYEAEWNDLVDAVMVVVAPREQRIARIIQRDQLPMSQIEARLAAQTSDAKKIKCANFIIYNTHDILALERQTKNIFENYLRNENRLCIRSRVR